MLTAINRSWQIVTYYDYVSTCLYAAHRSEPCDAANGRCQIALRLGDLIINPSQTEPVCMSGTCHCSSTSTLANVHLKGNNISFCRCKCVNFLPIHCTYKMLFCSYAYLQNIECVCTSNFVMVPLNLTCLLRLQHYFSEHLFNVYYNSICIYIRHSHNSKR